MPVRNEARDAGNEGSDCHNEVSYYVDRETMEDKEDREERKVEDGFEEV